MVLDGKGLEAFEDFDLSKEKLPPSSLKSEKTALVGKMSYFLQTAAEISEMMLMARILEAAVGAGEK